MCTHCWLHTHIHAIRKLTFPPRSNLKNTYWKPAKKRTHHQILLTLFIFRFKRWICHFVWSVYQIIYFIYCSLYGRNGLSHAWVNVRQSRVYEIGISICLSLSHTVHNFNRFIYFCSYSVWHFFVCIALAFGERHDFIQTNSAMRLYLVLSFRQGANRSRK